MSASYASSPALHTALRDLMRVHAPTATLMATLDQHVVSISADEPLSSSPGAELIPPDVWLDRGDLAWLTRDGALLGLVWSENQPITRSVVEMLTLLLAAARQGPNQEAEMLLTQLPIPTAWLTADLTFKQVSRSFLEMFDLTGKDVVGKNLLQIFPDSAEMARQLETAVAGRAIRLRDELLPKKDNKTADCWIRGEAKPYFGANVAGALWTVQDVTGEYMQASEVSALLDTSAPVALLDKSGKVIKSSQGLTKLLEGYKEDIDPESKFWNWPCFHADSKIILKELTTEADGTRVMDVPMANGSKLSLTARRSSFAPKICIVEGPSSNGESHASQAVVSQVLTQSATATVLLDHAGRLQLVSDQAADLLGLDATNLIGLNLSRVVQQIGLRLHSPDGEPLPLPDLKGLTLPSTKEVFILLPGRGARQMEVRLSKVEASDGGKPGMLMTLRDVTALRRAQAKLRHDAIHDTLTGLLNRVGLRSFLSGLSEDGETIDKENKVKSGMVACLDLDGFGALNAALGRTAGDLLLIQVAARLNDLAMAHNGRAARFADDSFAIHLPHINALVGVQKIQAALREPLRAGKRAVPLTFSIGAATVQIGSPETTMADADVALQHAKRQGRSQVTLFEPSLRDAEAQSFELEDELRALLNNEQQEEQFSLLYQPAVSLKDGRALSAEALLRWTHPKYGNVSPARFLPIASQSDMIIQISEWVVSSAIQGRNIIREHMKNKTWRTSVNLNLQELTHEGARERLMPLVSRQGAIDIEVSAGSLIDHSNETLGLLEGLKAKGARLIVDDFGDGASSLTALTQFPLSGLKLHPTLTARLPDDDKSLKLVEGTIRLAHSLNLTVTAVGVENYSQLDVLRDLGCDAAQGYAITPPLNTENLTEWLQQR